MSGNMVWQEKCRRDSRLSADFPDALLCGPFLAPELFYFMLFKKIIHDPDQFFRRFNDR